MSISAVSLPSSVQGAAAAATTLFSTNLSSSLSGSSCFRGLALARKNENGLVVSASSNDAVAAPLTGVVFQPFEEVKKDDFVVPIAPDTSVARQRFCQDCESAVNEQIK